LNVNDHATFLSALETFLVGVPAEEYPRVAAIAMAGPVTNNTVFMANAEKWGTMDGHQLG
jgi:glucokinase